MGLQKRPYFRNFGLFFFAVFLPFFFSWRFFYKNASYAPPLDAPPDPPEVVGVQKLTNFPPLYASSLLAMCVRLDSFDKWFVMCVESVLRRGSLSRSKQSVVRRIDL